jgi:hypothetical protein
MLGYVGLVGLCWAMLGYAGLCWAMLGYAGLCSILSLLYNNKLHYLYLLYLTLISICGSFCNFLQKILSGKIANELKMFKLNVK